MIESTRFQQSTGAMRHMSSLHRHSLLPSGAFDVSALPEDLAPALEQSSFFGRDGILLASSDYGLGHFPRIREKIIQQSLVPQRYLSLDEFSLSGEFTGGLPEGARFAVMIDRVPTAAAIERMLSTRHQLEQLTYVLIGRKDWRFKDTFRSLPHFIRPRLFLDFPVSLHSSDHFYAPTELASILHELKVDLELKEARSFCPHFHLRRELLGANVIAVSGPNGHSGDDPALSIVASDPEVVSSLAQSGLLQKLGSEIEVVVPRVIGQEARLIPELPGLRLSYVWLHLENPAGNFREMRAHLLNWGARYSRGKSILFGSGEVPGDLNAALEQFFLEGRSGENILRSGRGFVVDAGRFREAGGFDPLYSYFGLGDAEFLYRYLGALRPEAEDGELARSLKGRIRGPYAGLGLKLFYHQYFDQPFFRYFSQSSLGAGQAAEGEDADSPLHNHLRYRMEQSRDAYLSLYKASPKVAIHGNIQLLLRPYHWLKPHAWRLKMPAYPLIVKPYHWLKLHVWRLKVPAYVLFVRPLHWFQRNPYQWMQSGAINGYHFARRHLWRLSLPLTVPYHFVRNHLWRLKLAFFLVRDNLWRVKQAYYFFFRLFFPVRKVFYFCEYQYEKRILGLYGRQYRWIKR